MEYRLANEYDQREIVEVLKVSLGEHLMPKSIAFWQWKHENNPFGKSKVLLAIHDGKIVGVRAFLRWDWEKEGLIFRSLRAVDTSVLPEYQGKGVFSSLTSSLLEKCKLEGYDFIFNTPNKISLPGYLKLGWVKYGRLPLKIKFVTSNIKNTSCSDNFELKNPEQFFPLFKSGSKNMRTLISPEYLAWRYQNCPSVKYSWISDKETFALVYRTKEGGFLGKELRIVDVFTFKDKDTIHEALLNQYLNCAAKNENVRYISLLSNEESVFQLRGFGCLPELERGPILTLRDLNLSDDFKKLIKKENWGFSLGDLEVF